LAPQLFLPRSTSDLLVGLSGISAGTSSNPVLDFIVECIPNSKNTEWILSTALNAKIRKNTDFGIPRCRAGHLKYQVDWEGRPFGSSRSFPPLRRLTGRFRFIPMTEHRRMACACLKGANKRHSLSRSVKTTIRPDRPRSRVGSAAPHQKLARKLNRSVKVPGDFAELAQAFPTH
jgi:hypothetical protein